MKFSESQVINMLDQSPLEQHFTFTEINVSDILIAQEEASKSNEHHKDRKPFFMYLVFL